MHRATLLTLCDAFTVRSAIWATAPRPVRLEQDVRCRDFMGAGTAGQKQMYPTAHRRFLKESALQQLTHFRQKGESDSQVAPGVKDAGATRKDRHRASAERSSSTLSGVIMMFEKAFLAHRRLKVPNPEGFSGVWVDVSLEEYKGIGDCSHPENTGG